jgi:hypothetical protein
LIFHLLEAGEIQEERIGWVEPVDRDERWG